ncbi:MAG: PAS domain S-box protein [Acidimicrobiales bacterium]
MPQTTAKTRTRAAAKKAPASGSTRTRANAKDRQEDQLRDFKEQALDASSAAIMMVDSDFVIYYVNEAARTLMASAQDSLQKTWPSFDADNMVGECLDQFHPELSPQSRMLDDPANLPYSTNLEVGGLSLSLKVSAQVSGSGEFVGCTLEWENIGELLEMNSKLESINVGQAMIEFDLEGNILSCNDNFLAATGYALDEIVGRHHRIFVDPIDAASPAYAAFWDQLRNGDSVNGEVKRVNKAGETLWLQASYNPVLDREGKVVKYFKIASDITEAKLRSWDLEAKMASIDTGQAMIEFDLDGNITGCNDNFLAATGYALDEIVGRHHRIFVDPLEAADPAYNAFWARLRNGESVDGEVKRVNKAGETVWLRASYNPVLGDDGQPVKFFKIASDITEAKLRSWDLEAKMAAVERAQATIEFDLDGNVVAFNDNFQATMGYTLDEIKGRHHRTFVESDIAADRAYTEFWETLKRGQPVEGEFRRVNKAGDIVWLRASYNPVLGEDGKPVKFFKIASDITEEKRFRDQIETIVGRTSEVMTAVSLGDLTQTVAGEYEGSLKPLQVATNSSIENLSGLVSQIRDSTSSMSTSAKEVALANQDLSRRTEGQASSLEETAASMEEMTATVEQNADNARKASQLAVGAREQAEGGGDVVEKAVAAMGAISESSKKIADIIGVIDEIAFQTNLLALNAAVEAARAGDQGRGFAVVASEVRNLAQRSAGAAKEIKNLISDSLDKVDDGSKLVNQSGTQLEEIVNSVKKVSDIIGEIAAASEEQSIGINQVNQAVADMDQGTQQNAAMVEEAAAASESMQQQSTALQALTERFRIGGAQGPAPQGGGLAMASAPVAQPMQAPVPAQPSPEAAAPTTHFAEPSGDDQAWEEF